MICDYCTFWHVQPVSSNTCLFMVLFPNIKVSPPQNKLYYSYLNSWFTNGKTCFKTRVCLYITILIEWPATFSKIVGHKRSVTTQRRLHPTVLFHIHDQTHNEGTDVDCTFFPHRIYFNECKTTSSVFCRNENVTHTQDEVETRCRGQVTS